MEVQRKTLHQLLELDPVGEPLPLMWFHDVGDPNDLKEDRVAVGFLTDALEEQVSYTGIARLRASSQEELKALKAHCMTVWSGKKPDVLIAPSDDGNSRPLIFMPDEDNGLSDEEDAELSKVADERFSEDADYVPDEEVK